jgi:hypothetical protein
MDPALGKLLNSVNKVNYSLADGHQLLYDREAPFELRIQDPNNGPQEVGTLEAIRVKILVLVSGPTSNPPISTQPDCDTHRVALFRLTTTITSPP